MSAIVPDMLSISRQYAALPPDKRAIFRSQLFARGIPAARLPMVAFPGRTYRFALSHAQERLWFLWKLESQSAAYNIVGAVRLAGRLDIAAVRAALDGVVTRHESLRTHFEAVDGMTWQVVGSTATYGWSEYDFSSLAEGKRESRLTETLRELSLQPFDLEHGPLLRVALMRLAEHEHIVHFAMHHIISDGWSQEILVKEFATFYDAALAGKDAALPALPIQYGDYALWQREWLDEPALVGQLDYWRDRLGTDHPVLELPTDRKRTGGRSAAGGRVQQALSPELAHKLRHLAQRHGATLFMTLLAAYNVLLYRYSGQQDIRIGVPVAGRDRLETEGLIGFFINTLVIRSVFSGSDTFGAFLGQVRTSVLEAQAHQDLPFARLVEALQPERSLNHTPLFQVMFNYAGADSTDVALPALKLSEMASKAVTARFDLVLNIAEGAGLAVSFTYAEDLFNAATIERLLAHYIAILEQVTGAADTRLGEIVLSVPASLSRWRTIPSVRSCTGSRRRLRRSHSGRRCIARANGCATAHWKRGRTAFGTGCSASECTGMNASGCA